MISGNVGNSAGGSHTPIIHSLQLLTFILPQHRIQKWMLGILLAIKNELYLTVFPSCPLSVLGPIWAPQSISLPMAVPQSVGSAVADTVLWRGMLRLSVLCFLLTSLHANINHLEHAVWTWSLHCEVTVSLLLLSGGQGSLQQHRTLRDIHGVSVN